jgi:hypothetical protein
MDNCATGFVLSVLVAMAGHGEGPAESSGQSGPRPSTGMRLELQQENETTVRLAVFNGSAKTYLVNGGMVWTGQSSPKQFRGVDIEVRTSAGEILPYVCRDHPLMAVRTDYVVLYPRHFVGQEITLGDCLDMRRPGRYGVVARYLHSGEWADVVAGLPSGFPRFDQPLTSPRLSLVTNGEEPPGPHSAESHPRLSGSFRLELQRLSGTIVRVALYNGSEKIRWVNHSMLWNAPSAPKELRQIDIEVTGPDGKRLPYGCREHGRKAVPADYVFLYPARFVGAEVSLGECLDLRRPGRYRVVAHFLDSSNVSGLQGEADYPRFDQPLTSSPLDLVIE